MMPSAGSDQVRQRLQRRFQEAAQEFQQDDAPWADIQAPPVPSMPSFTAAPPPLFPSAASRRLDDETPVADEEVMRLRDALKLSYDRQEKLKREIQDIQAARLR